MRTASDGRVELLTRIELILRKRGKAPRACTRIAVTLILVISIFVITWEVSGQMDLGCDLT